MIAAPSAALSPVPAPLAAAPAAQLTCAEVWGGNRPVDLAVSVPGMRGWLLSEPYEGGRGGDVHYLSVCGSGLLARLCLADVAGHGEKVAEISQALHRQLRRHMETLDQRMVLRKLNAELCENEFDGFATAALVTYYPPSRKLSVSYAGHPPIWLLRQAVGGWAPLAANEDDERSAKSKKVNFPLAIDADVAYTRATEQLELGDRILVLTDGVLEAMRADGEQFGDERLRQYLDANLTTPAQQLVQGLYARISDWTNHRRQDDVSILAMDTVAGPPGPVAWTAFKNRLLRPMGLMAKKPALPLG